MAHSRKMRVTLWSATAVLALALGCQLLVDLDGLQDMHCGPTEKACPGGCVPKDRPSTGCSDIGCAPCALPHAKATCGQNGHCIVDSCVGDWDDCDTIDMNGCEVDKAHDPRHCGGCFEPCPKPPNGSAGCSEGHCGIGSCIARYGDCDNDPDGGCEEEIWTDEKCLSCTVGCDAGTHCAEGMCK
jgi:hypothetical protein